MGRKKILLTKKEAKRARKRYVSRKKRYGNRRDSDRDGVPDYKDGHPRDPKRHSFVGGLVTGIGTEVARRSVKSLAKRNTPSKKKVSKVFNPFLEIERVVRKDSKRKR